jgi:hypothetical protein
MNGEIWNCPVDQIQDFTQGDLGRQLGGLTAQVPVRPADRHPARPQRQHGLARRPARGGRQRHRLAAQPGQALSAIEQPRAVFQPTVVLDPDQQLGLG